MDGEDIWRAIDAERDGLHRVLAQLPEPQWRSPSLCDQWQIRDVAAHLVLVTQANAARLLVNLVRARGSIDRLVSDTATRHAADTDDQDLLAEFRGTIGSRFTAVGTTPTDRLMDILVHGQDIAVPLGIDREMPTSAAQLAMERVWTMGFPFRASARLAGYRLRALDTDWSAGAGPTIEGPVSALLLLATGRTRAALPRLTGEGAAMLTG